MSIPVVYDTMLFFQAASRPTRIHASIQAVFDARVTLCISPALLAEIQDVLTRPEYQLRFPALKPEDVAFFLTDITSRATMFDPIPAAFTLPLHTKDDHIFNLAILAKAKYLVTWERRILSLATEDTAAASLHRQLAPALEIITPKKLSEVLRSGEERS